MQFAHEWVLSLLVIVPVIGAVWLWLIRRQWRRFELMFDPALRNRFVPPPSWHRLAPQFICLLLALSLAVIALARPRWGMFDQDLVEPQHDLVVALDVSRSMLARDVSPNRLERAKAMVYDLIQANADKRIALVAFRAGAQRICPLTRDTDFLLQTLNGMHIDSAPQGPTDLAPAIHMALDSFDPDRTGSRTVFLISDGEDLAGRMDDALQDALRNEVRFITIGIGTKDGAPIPDERSPTGYQKYDGERVVTRLIHETLERIARETGGIHVPAAEDMIDLYSVLRQFPPPVTTDPQTKEWVADLTEQYPWFLLAAVLFLLTTVFLSRGRIPADIARETLVAVLLFWSMPASGHGNTANDSPPPPARPARQAIDRYHRGDHRAAAELFEIAEARETSPAIRATLLYNAAYARYRAGDYDTAVYRFQEALDLDSEPRPALRHDLALAKLAAARTALREATNNIDRITDIRASLQHAIAQVEQALQESPQQQAWHSTYNHLDQTLAHVMAIEQSLQIVAEYGDWTPSELIDELLQRQRVIHRDLASADRAPLPQRLRRQQELAHQQRAVADLTPILSTAVGKDSDHAQQIQAAAQTTRKAVDWIADGDDRAAATAHHAVVLFETIQQLLPPLPDDPEPEPPEKKPDDPNDTPELPIPFDPPPHIRDIPDDPPDIPEAPDKEIPGDELWDTEQIDMLLDKIRRHERDYLDERRRRTISPAPEDRDW